MRRTNDSAVAGLVMFVMSIGWIVFCLALACLKLWLIGSLITSTVKAVSRDCGSTYGVESVLSGNWFCPTDKPKQTSDNADKPSPVSGAY